MNENRLDDYLDHMRLAADAEAGRIYTREAMLKKLGVGSGRKKAA